jgi:hypothetical protein
VTTVADRATETSTFICGLCEKPFTLDPDDKRYTTTEWADDGYFGMPGEPTERRSA